MDDNPRFNSFPVHESDWKVLSRVIGRLVDHYIIVERFKQFNPEQNTSMPRSTDFYQNPHAIRIRKEHSYCIPITAHVISEHCYAKKTENRNQKSRKLPETVMATRDIPHATESVRENIPDGVFNYACCVLNDGLLLLEFRDAIHEGDGPRILRCWKFLLIYYRHAKHYKYALEAFNLLAQVNVLASARMRNQLTWSRVVNARGGVGRNIPVDLHNEHLNRKLKDVISGVGANVTEKLIVEVSKSIQALDTICENFDHATLVRPESVHHTRKASEGDLKAVVKQLVQSNVFSYIPGRQHRSFANDKSMPNLLRSIDTKGLFTWLHQKQTELANRIEFQNLFKT